MEIHVSSNPLRMKTVLPGFGALGPPDVTHRESRFPSESKYDLRRKD
jgi:hypothetical protein